VGRMASEQAMRLAAPGRTVVLLADGTKATGLLAFEDGIRPEAKATVDPRHPEPGNGALLHELSSIPVIANSARLIRAR
jgi:cation transport ATPase